MSGNHSNTTTTDTETNSETRPILHLRNNKKDKKEKPKVRWTNDVVDNENMDKKKSKICCIFHPQREFGELSSESSDSSSDESDQSDDGAGEGESNASNGTPGHDACCGNHKRKQGKLKKSTPNAYEKQPTHKNK
ncbi:Type 1 phosphatases regulator YPI1 [Debaryomyces fabryi]|uniref:Type 1 phosphatases regulator n=1 Tax=Debaryomyces fabryi TaxID=58627 RepID=A0A0V1PTW6_9ASCO|nr:Type 1 phosphatases regulator YPI1 [Debaryomyces fabryi]KRZ99615.1 Type 1 phosphatases regulator YPI1 [Debaryomyces fabryi]CUM56495.1 unnamed protein product [Debaryomyces fabryi]